MRKGLAWGQQIPLQFGDAGQIRAGHEGLLPRDQNFNRQQALFPDPPQHHPKVSNLNTTRLDHKTITANQQIKKTIIKQRRCVCS
jgi:hypothetical protein